MKLFLFFLISVICFASSNMAAQPTAQRVEQLESRVDKIERAGRDYGGVAFIAAVLAALWAQNSRRNAWLWFFLGLLFAPISLFVLLYKNSNDRRRMR